MNDKQIDQLLKDHFDRLSHQKREDFIVPRALKKLIFLSSSLLFPRDYRKTDSPRQ